MIEQLASLLLPIDALLSHPDFDIHLGSSSGAVSLFRNMWFLCVLFHFTTDDKQETAMEWQQPALARIAAKTPPMIYEEAHDSLASELEYSSVIRQEYAHTVRHHLSALFPFNDGQVRSSRNIGLRWSDTSSFVQATFGPYPLARLSFCSQCMISSACELQLG
jgi:phosphatidylinositol 4-kinase